MKFESVICLEKNNGLSYQDTLPWLKDKLGDLEYVRTITSMCPLDKKNIIIVGRKTFYTLPEAFYKNSNRIICVLTRNKFKFNLEKLEKYPNIHIYSDYKSLFNYLYSNHKDINKIFVFGGCEIYKYFLENVLISKLYITRIHKEYDCDIHLPQNLIEDNYVLSSITDKDTKERTFEIWERKCHPEYNYLELLENVYLNGEKRETRNGITYSSFGHTLEFDIEKYGFPLITTKKMFFKGIAKELLWFLKGETNANILKEQGVHIWDGNTSREYLDTIGLSHYPEGCAGPIYGYQWRFFNAPYDFSNMKAIENTSGIDQLVSCIKEIKSNPSSRRLIINSWNVSQLNEMCLPPCHVMYQFYVIDGRLSCQMYQRSADLFLGLPFNIASTALLTYIIASITSYNVGKIKICIGDAHIYQEHLDNVLEQISRKPLEFCKINVTNNYKELSIEEQLEKLCYEDISIENYISHGVLKSLMKA